MNVSAQEKIEQVLPEPESNRVRISLDRSLYPLDAVYGASYVFIDRCFVYLDAPGPDRIEVLLQGRDDLEKSGLEVLAGEFANELLSHAWRHEIAEANRPILEAVTAQAMAGALGTPALEDLDDLDEMDFSEETFEDPLGIAMSWEEKYGKLADGEEKTDDAEDEAAGSSSDDGGDGDQEETKAED